MSHVSLYLLKSCIIIAAVGRCVQLCCESERWHHVYSACQQNLVHEAKMLSYSNTSKLSSSNTVFMSFSISVVDQAFQYSSNQPTVKAVLDVTLTTDRRSVYVLEKDVGFSCKSMSVA